MKRFLLICSTLAGFLVAPVSPKSAIETEFFPYTGGWLGGDAAYSIPLDATTTVWLFGDTFVGKQRAENTMIHNSIAIRKCNRSCELKYWWFGMHTDKPDAFFHTPETNYYWPLDGFLHDGRLYVFLEQMHATSEGGAFGFDYSAIRLAAISNPKDDPDQWVISYRTVSEGNAVVPGIAAVARAESDQNFVYVFTLFRRSAPQPFVGLMRCPLADLPTGRSRIGWQYLSKGGHWRDWVSSTSPGDAGKALDGNVTEMTVKYRPKSHSWLAIFPTPGFLSQTASYAESPNLIGPWTAPRPFFRYPEMETNNVLYTPSVFCYAAKEHPELESNAGLVFTYACNSMKEPEIFRDVRLYRPEVVREGFPPTALGPTRPSE